MYGDIPYVVNGEQVDFKALFKSDPNAAIIPGITIMAGYGVLRAGTIMAKNLSAAGDAGKFVPYNLTTFDGTEVSPGRAYLVADADNSGESVNVTINDSYKFTVGDDLILNSSGAAAENLGAITAIDNTTYASYAVITATTTISSASHTTANTAYVCVEAGDSSNNYSDAIGILSESVDTGTGLNSQGAVAGIIASNAEVYQGLLTGLDAAAIVDLSATSWGQTLVVK